MRKHSSDTLFGDSIHIKQNKTGYRFTIDPVLLAHYATPEPGDKIIDIGTGCGIIPMILLYRTPGIHVTGIEIQPGLAGLACENISLNRFEKNVSIHCGDITDPVFLSTHSGGYDMVITNPPYTAKNAGRINPDNEKAIARHEITITLAQLISSASDLLKNTGRMIIIYPQDRLVDLLLSFRQSGIEPKKIRMIHPKRDNPARRVIVEGYKYGRPGVVMEKPLYIYESEDIYTDEVKKMLQGH